MAGDTLVIYGTTCDLTLHGTTLDGLSCRMDNFTLLISILNGETAVTLREDGTLSLEMSDLTLWYERTGDAPEAAAEPTAEFNPAVTPEPAAAEIMLEKKYVMTDADVSGYNMTAAQLGNYEYSLLFHEDGTVKSEESSGPIVQKEMDKSTEAASGETAGEGKDSEGSAKTPEAGETTEEGKGIEAPDADISEPVKDAEGKIIGTASKEERTEQETTITPTSPDSEKLVDSTVNPDGSVTNRYETSHTADKTTTNTTTGTVTADTKEIFVTDGKEVDLKQELGKDYQEKLKWDTVDGTSFNGYTVGIFNDTATPEIYTPVNVVW